MYYTLNTLLYNTLNIIYYTLYYIYIIYYILYIVIYIILYILKKYFYIIYIYYLKIMYIYIYWYLYRVASCSFHCILVRRKYVWKKLGENREMESRSEHLLEQLMLHTSYIWWYFFHSFAGYSLFSNLAHSFAGYTLWQINIDPENHHFLMETNLPTPSARVYVNLLVGTISLFCS